ncbi:MULTISPECIES: hypothetical protein [unclassified Corynebacterium]|uniref:hypothetical protein n=1 Tax=unclassified Corynebacterium TaxID=2624378 RepID=UPI0029CA2A5D|nr:MULTISPECIES: hypothetical protein [unclassified Corynebacterium]WPF66121.1 hypothetical protein OLX12_11335 [Corynebacterium sp. 22KM0430]WPF68613.1 hypothetical protein OLW90_11330 [Corynebacterium sp. 21KM1197]
MRFAKIFDLLIFLLAAASFLFFQSYPVLGFALVALLVLRFVIEYRGQRKELSLILVLSSLAVTVLAVFTDRYSVIMAAAVITSLSFLALLFQGAGRTIKESPKRGKKILAGVGIVGLGLSSILVGGLSYTAFFPDVLARSLQGQHSTEPSLEKTMMALCIIRI